MVSFTSRPLYPQGKSPRYPLDRRLDGPQNQSGRRGEETILAPIGTRTPAPRSPSLQPVAIPTALSRVIIIIIIIIIIPVLGPTQPPIQWVPGPHSPGMQWPGREADQSSPSSAEVKKYVDLYTHSPIRLHGTVLN
jgi:hypothetical protein